MSQANRRREQQRDLNRIINAGIERATTDDVAHDLARLIKAQEELGEATRELIALHGLNFRKGDPDPLAPARYGTELLDAAATLLLAYNDWTDLDAIAAVEEHITRLARRAGVAP